MASIPSIASTDPSCVVSCSSSAGDISTDSDSGFFSSDRGTYFSSGDTTPSELEFLRGRCQDLERENDELEDEIADFAFQRARRKRALTFFKGCFYREIIENRLKTIVSLALFSIAIISSLYTYVSLDSFKNNAEVGSKSYSVLMKIELLSMITLVFSIPTAISYLTCFPRKMRARLVVAKPAPRARAVAPIQVTSESAPHGRALGPRNVVLIDCELV